MYKIFIFTFCLFVMGCASDRKKARSFMETSKWEMARVYWGKVLKEDPSDEEARLSKSRYRQKYVYFFS